MKRFIRELSHYMVFFLLCAFIVTCCILLFTNELVSALNITLTSENLNMAAKMTFINIVILSLIFTLIDLFRRKWTVERTARQIVRAANQIVSGDFSARVAPAAPFVTDENFQEIIDCFNRMAQELASVETLRTDFISNVSHEMKTPLAIMQNYAALLKTDGLPEAKRQEYAGEIIRSCRRLSDMIANILKLSKLENQQIFPHQERYDLGEQLCEALLQFEDIWEAKDICIETELEENIHIFADRELLMLVWNNLLSNAFKFTPSGGKVSIKLLATESSAIVTVQDNGCGMSTETGMHIFEKFYQGDTSHAGNGNGLGLALVKRIVDIIGGEIHVESTLGKGSTFSVTIERIR